MMAAMFHFQLAFTGTSKPRVFFRFQFPLFIHTVQQRHSFRIRAHIKAAFRATITTQPKNRCAINGFVYIAVRNMGIVVEVLVLENKLDRN